MKIIKLIFIWLGLIGSMFPNMVFAESSGKTGGVILKLPVSTRAVSLGEAFSAVRGDIACVNYNPAGLCGLNNKQVALSYIDGLMDSYFSYLCYHQKIKGYNMAFGGGGLNGGSANIYEYNRDEPKEINASEDFYLQITGAKEYKKDLSLGASIKLINTNLAEGKYKASAMAVDVGAIYKIKKISIGVGLQNLGTKLKSDALPLTLLVGASTEPLPDLLILVQGKEIFEEKFTQSLGIEYRYEMFSFRTGYKFGYDAQNICGGIGMILNNISFDIAYAPIKDLESDLRLSVGLGF